MDTHASSKSATNRKARALLAGGLVLGVGAVVTLAAWNDSEFAAGEFSAGHFDLEGSTTDGVAFDQHASSGSAANLAFTTPLSDQMSPDDVVYAPFAVRLAENTTDPANVAVLVDSTTGDVADLTYTLVATSSWGCDESAVADGEVLVPAGTPVTDTAGDPTFSLDHGEPTSNPGEAQNLCFAVEAGDITQGQTGTVTWEFAATSTQ